MSIIIGGPPSSGSSLLSTILNRHSRIKCFQETHLLAKHQLYKNWKSNKGRLKGGRLCSPGWHMYNNVDLPDVLAEYGAELHTSISVCEFASRYFLSIAQEEGKSIWAEKTPMNIYFFHTIHSQLSDASFIFTIRDPYDSIASLIMRGKSILDSVALILLHLGIGLIQNERLDLLTMRYEDLVTRPSALIENLCHFVDLNFEPEMLEPDKSPEIKMAGWKHYEDGRIEKSSLNRFDDLSTEVQQQVSYLVNKLYINPHHLVKYDIIANVNEFTPINLLSLIRQFKYEEKQIAAKGSSVTLSLFCDRFKRLVHAHPTTMTYPIYHE